MDVVVRDSVEKDGNPSASLSNFQATMLHGFATDCGINGLDLNGFPGLVSNGPDAGSMAEPILIAWEPIEGFLGLEGQEWHAQRALARVLAQKLPLP